MHASPDPRSQGGPSIASPRQRLAQIGDPLGGSFSPSPTLPCERPVFLFQRLAIPPFSPLIGLPTCPSQASARFRHVFDSDPDSSCVQQAVTPFSRCNHFFVLQILLHALCTNFPSNTSSNLSRLQDCSPAVISNAKLQAPQHPLTVIQSQTCLTLAYDPRSPRWFLRTG